MSRQTNCAYVEKVGGPIIVGKLEAPDPGPQQVLVRIRASGVCHTDESVRTGAFPLPVPCILGHEGAGVVEAIGREVTSVKRGDKVVVVGIQPCGQCPTCYNNQPELCEKQFDKIAAAPLYQGSGKNMPGMGGLGTFSELMTTNEIGVVKVNTDLPFDQLALIGCGVLTGVGAAFRSAKIKPGDTVAVVGCGGVGLSIIQAARIAGASKIIAVDPVAMKRKAALELGATHEVDTGNGDAVERVLALARGVGVDVALEAVGRGSTLTQAFRMTRRGGTVVAVGVGGDDPFSISTNEFVLGGKTMVGSVSGAGHPHREVPHCVAMAERGLFKLDHLVTRHFALQDIHQAFELMHRGEALRSVINFD